MFPGITPNNMVLNSIPQSYNTPMMLSGMQLLRVKSLDGAKAYPTQPNSMYPLFDEDKDILYVKITDSNNFPTIRTFELIEKIEKEPEIKMDMQYATIDDFNKLREEIENVKQLIQKSDDAVTAKSSAPERSNFSKSNNSSKVGVGTT